MANPEHLDIIKQGVKVWNKWREQNPGILPNLEGAHLIGANLNHAHLGGAYLNQAHLSRANLFQANLYHATLNGAHLDSADLRGSDLAASYLDGAKLIKAHLIGANLNRAHLSGASLTEANLNSADLSWADLTRTDLTGAGLYEAKFSKARLEENNFNSAIMRGTVLGDVDLSTAKGLAQVQHQGPSTIGIDTLYRSKGTIPEIFLRGAGVPDEIIALQSNLRGKSKEFYSVFISYSHADKSFARQLHERLKGRGIRCWLDEHQLLPGDPVYESIYQGIRLWDKVLLCCSESSLNSWWVDNELKTALEKEQRILKDEKRRVWAVIPLDLDGYVFSKECKSALSTQIKSRSVARFEGWEHNDALFEAQFERVLAALRTGDGGRGDPPKSRL
jgi:uncharacterized protein YjbI with pentapeptide repeats